MTVFLTHLPIKNKKYIHQQNGLHKKGRSSNT